MKDIAVILGAMQHRYTEIYSRVPYNFHCIGYEKRGDFKFPDWSDWNIKDYKIKVPEILNTERAINDIRAPFRAAVFISQVNLLLKKIKPDIVHSHFVYPNTFTLRKPDIIQVHGTDVHSMKVRGYLRYPFKKVLERAEVVVAVSEYNRNIVEEVIDTGNTRTEVIYNHVDTEKFKPEKKDLFDRKTILYVGRFSEEKGIKVLVELNKILPEEYQIVCLGFGPLRDYLIKNNIKVIPYSSNPEDYINSAYCLILPSSYEGLPFCVMETMACGKYPLATPVGAVTEMIDDKKDGFLINKNAGDILESIKENEDILNEINYEGIKKVKSRFTIEASASQHITMYDSLK